MSSLYELTAEFTDLLDAGEAIDEETGEVIEGDAFRARLTLLKGDIKAKIHGCMAVRADFAYRAKALRDEAARLTNRARTLENREESIKQYVIAGMEALGIKTVETSHFRVTLVPGRDGIEVVDMEQVPAAFQRVKVEADKAGAKAHMKAHGELPPGFAVTQGTPWLRVS